MTGIYHVYHMFTPEFLFAEIFARGKFVQIHFFVQCFILELLMKLFYMFTGLLSYHCLFLFSAFLTS